MKAWHTLALWFDALTFLISYLLVRTAVTPRPAADVPGKATYGLISQDQPVFASDVVRYVGEPIAVVIARSQAEAEDAADAVVADIETLPAVVKAQDAMVGKVLRNAVKWAFNADRHEHLMKAPNTPVDKAIEKLTERGAKLSSHPKS